MYMSKVNMKFLLLLMSLTFACSKECHYSTYNWNVNTTSVKNYKTVVKNYNEVKGFERNSLTGCSVCEEDQIEIRLSNIKPFKVCKYLALDVERTLIHAMHTGAIIDSITGYRVGLTRGDVDEKGNRTEFSNHSFGIAIDINAEHNGLYDHCKEFSSLCHLRKGGVWTLQNPKSLQETSMIVKNLKSIGLKWGGEIKGWQKDFMHFSPTGY